MRCLLIKVIQLILPALLLFGCASQPNKPEVPRLTYSESVLKKLFYEQFQEWASVRYRNGGLSKAGVDCSGFVYLTYQQKLGIRLPRSSGHQSQTGYPVRQNELKAGDLVFFKTEPTQNHVGIYLEQRRFMHVSSTKGVAISSLDDRYWASKYWKSIRVLG
ncbi:MAG: C40 family peptidase [Methylomicrobium sp.]|nr:C40 family peptidase [Methylomicrobium sp.]